SGLGQRRGERTAANTYEALRTPAKRHEHGRTLANRNEPLRSKTKPFRFLPLSGAGTGVNKTPMTASVVIAVDGPVAAGKGTLARRLADKYGYAYLDTGSLYRAVGARVLRQGGDPADAAIATKAAESLEESDLAAKDLRSEAVGLAASKVAVVPGVRAA